MRPKSAPRVRRIDPTLTLLIVGGIAASCAAFAVRERSEERSRAALFEALADGRVGTIERGLDGAVARVRATATYLTTTTALVEGDYAAFRPEFINYATELVATAPEMVAIVWVPRVEADEADAFLRRAQPPEGGFVLSDLQPDGSRTPTPPRAVHYPLAVLAPIASVPHGGTDLAADGARAERLEQAIRSGQPLIEPGDDVLRGSASSRSVAILIPLAFGGSRATADSVRDGFAVGVVDVETLMDQTVAGAPSAGVDVQLRDARSGRTLYPYRDSGADAPDDRWVRSFPLSIGDDRWIVDARAQPDFLAATRPLAPWTVLGTGLLLTFGLAGYVTLTRRRSETQLTFAAERRKAAAHLQAIFDTSLDAIVTADDHGVISEWNTSAERMFTWTADEVIGKTLADTIIPARGRESHLRSLAELRATGRSALLGQLIEYKMARKDTSEVPVELVMTPLPVEGRTRITAFIRDITQRKQAEEAMRRAHEELENRVRERTADLEQATALRAESERGLRVMMENAGDAVYLSDAGGRVVDVNLRACTMLGYTREELLALNIWDFETKADPRRPIGPRLGALALGEVMTSHGVQRRKDGTTFPVEVRVGPIEVRGQRLFLGLARDVTERRALEEALASARDQALEASRLKSDFLANMSHEIRTPLNGILGMTGLLLDSDLSPSQRDDLVTVRRSAEHLLALINDILDLARIEAGRFHVDASPFDLEDALHGAAGLLAAAAEQKGLEFILRIAPDAPRNVIGDGHRLRQVLMNLAGNAIKFTERGHVLLQAEPVGSDETCVDVRFAVIDTGVGIPPDDLLRVFEKFTQVDQSAHRRHGGTGLGLTISQELVEAMGGRIEARSTPGAGSEFFFTLPLPLGAAPERRVWPSDLIGARTLVVDDNAVNRRVLVEQLSAWQLEPTAVDSPAAALAELREAAGRGEPYRLVLLEYQMEEMTGLELACEIRDDPAIESPLVLLLSSVGRHFDQRTLTEAGILRWLTKPVSPSELLDAVTDAWEGRTRGALPAAAPDSAATERTVRVLLTEDSLVSQQVAVRMLQKLGCTVDVAQNGREAVLMAERSSYDLIFMDCQMPEMDGYDATRLIRVLEGGQRHTPIVALTAHAMAGDRELCLAAGMDDYLPKPVRREDLMAVVARYTGARASAPTASPPWERGARFDANALLDVVDGHPELAAKLARMFEEQSAGYLRALRAAVAAGDAGEIRRTGHALKGSAATLYGKRAAELGQRMEEAGKESDLATARSLIDPLDQEVRALQAELAAFAARMNRDRERSDS